MKETLNKIPTIPVGEIMGALSKTPGGKSLENTIRWSAYRGGETDAEWREMLGVTAIDTLHSRLMYGVMRSFLIHEGGRFTPEQQEAFLYGGLGHDFGEAKIDGEGVGDVPSPLKTAEHEKIESSMTTRVIESLPIADEIKNKLSYSYAQVVEGGDPELQNPFRALEKLEYAITGLKLFQNDRKREAAGLSIAINEKPLIGRAIAMNGLINILDSSLGFCPVDEYPESIGRWLHEMAPIIDEAYAYTVDFLREHGWAQTQDHNSLCDRFEELWEAFKASGNE